jgi:hypothetical protein
MTNYGLFRFNKIGVDDVKWMMESGYISAIGHEATAKLFSLVTGIDVQPNRLQVKMNVGDTAIVFWLNSRQPEGVVITDINTLERIGYSFGLITMLERAYNE